jgi:four helix bundle protein
MKYDLEDRTFKFAYNVRHYVDHLPGKLTGYEIGRQLVRSAGSVGANYIEANEALSKKDFIMRIRICRKEAKESHYWLRLSMPSGQHERTKAELMNEAIELMKIFAAILHKSTA